MYKNFIPTLTNMIPFLIVLGLLSSLNNTNTKLKKLLKTIEQEPIKYNNYPKYLSIQTTSKDIYSYVIKRLIAISLGAMIIFFILKNQNYYLFSVLAIFLYLLLIEYTPYYITIKEGKLCYKHLINTLNRTIEIPIGKIENISFFEYTEKEKFLLLYINSDTLIDINLSLVANYADIIEELDKYMCYRKNIDNRQINNKERIKIRNNFISFLIIVANFFIYEIVGIYSLFHGYHDIVTKAITVLFPILTVIIYPYKIKYQNKTIQYKHFVFTFNKTKTIELDKIDSISIYRELTSTFQITVYRYWLIIITQDKQIKVPLAFKNKSDVLRLVNCVNNNKKMQLKKWKI